MGLGSTVDLGQTPLDDEEKQALLIPSVTTRSELDEFEQLNIEEAIQWTLESRFDESEILTEAFVKRLHRRMYGNTWGWAGQFRTSNKNLGVDKFSIAVDLRALLTDARFWVESGTYEPDEICIRFKHRMVSIHCFANGNGRHSRLMADILAQRTFARPVFTWGLARLTHPGQARTAYISALRKADQGELEPLIEFARS